MISITPTQADPIGLALAQRYWELHPGSTKFVHKISDLLTPDFPTTLKLEAYLATIVAVRDNRHACKKCGAALILTSRAQLTRLVPCLSCNAPKAEPSPADNAIDYATLTDAEAVLVLALSNGAPSKAISSAVLETFSWTTPEELLQPLIERGIVQKLKARGRTPGGFYFSHHIEGSAVQGARTLLARPYNTKDSELYVLWRRYALAECYSYLDQLASYKGFSVSQPTLDAIEPVFSAGIKEYAVTEVWAAAWKAMKEAGLDESTLPTHLARLLPVPRSAKKTLGGRSVRYSPGSWDRKVKASPLGVVFHKILKIGDTTEGCDVRRRFKEVLDGGDAFVEFPPTPVVMPTPPTAETTKPHVSKKDLANTPLEVRGYIFWLERQIAGLQSEVSHLHQYLADEAA